MIVDTKTGEIYDRPPRRSWDTRKMRRKRPDVTRDVILALSLYSIAATAFIIGLLQ